MKYLGIDFGAKRVGVAVSDARGTIAFPRSTIPNDERLLAQLQEVVRVDEVESIVVGDTRSHGGAPNTISDKADAFAASLARETGLPLERSWEAWSSIEAGKLAPKGAEHNDASAAAFILQRFLDMKKNGVE